jgi:hypothetical protein
VELADFNSMKFLVEPELGNALRFRDVAVDPSVPGIVPSVSSRLPDATTTGRIQMPVVINKVVAQQRSRGVASQEVCPSSEDLKDVRGACVGNSPSVVDILRE